MKNEFMIKNVKTGEIIMKPKPTDNEIIFDGGTMITETDLKGNITYANRKFLEITGYSKKEVIGSPHCINRHSDMPKGAFRYLWKTVFQGKTWNGYVKNLAKDGSFYWVDVYISPKYNEKNEIVGFIAARKKVDPEKVKETEAIYETYFGDEHIDSKIFECHFQDILDLIQKK